jgi:hypothetical protein
MARFSNYGGLDDAALADGDVAFVRMNTRLRADQLQPGELALSENGRMETNGEWQPREGYDNLSGALTQDGVGVFILAEAAAGAWYVYADVAISAADYDTTAAGVVYVQTSGAHGLVDGSVANIENLGFANTDPNGNRVVTVTSSTEFTFALTSTSESYTTGSSPQVGTIKIGQNTLREVYGSCVLSDPNDSNAEYVVIVTTDKAIAYKLNAADVAASAVDIDYPGGGSIVSDVDVKQAFDYVTIFRNSATAWEWDGDFSGGLAFVAVSSGSKTQHVIYTAATNTTISAGVVTVSETSHGRSVGDKVTVVATASGLTAGSEYEIATVPGANSFTFYADADDVSAQHVVYSTKASLGGGYINMPAAPWGVYHQRRWWLPYFYTDAGSPADRGVRDEIIASDILDRGTFDPIGNQYRITAGIADFTVALHPFNDDNLLAFNRNSIHVLKGVSGSLADVTTVALTDAVGCAARKSIQQYGEKVLFLSDNGVYSVSFIDEYNLRGDEMPLSESINTLIDRINKSYFAGAVSVIHDNRYYLAVPLDDSVENNAILIYNFLNQGWESIDTTGANNFNVLNFHVGRSGQYNNLYVVTTNGGLYRVSDTGRITDELVNSDGSSTLVEIDVPSAATTRRYILGTMENKKWNRAEVHIESADNSASDGAISVILENTDATVELGTLVDIDGAELPTSEAKIYRQRIGNKRAYGAQIKFTPSLGRPSLRAVRLQGMAAQRQQQTLS